VLVASRLEGVSGDERDRRWIVQIHVDARL